MKENVRHKTFNFCLTQFPGRFFLATIAILYPTTEKNHPVLQTINNRHTDIKSHTLTSNYS